MFSKRMKQATEHFFVTHWFAKPGWVSALLWPLSLLFRLLIIGRRFYYLKFPGASTRVAVPVIIVGNISVGGTGKTPLVIAMALYLKKKGFRPGIISRGYGANVLKTIQVTDQHCALDVGDEVIEIFSRSECPVVVSKKRPDAAKQLVRLGCNVIISDDGLQHYALARDIEIAVIDGDRRFGNGFCLPAGPLREPVSRLASVDLIVCNGGVPDDHQYAMQFEPSAVINVADPSKTMRLDEAQQHDWWACAGIGNPQRFFQTLKKQAILPVQTVFYPDHHAFSKEDIDFARAQWVIMTGKDAVKCQAFADGRHWYLWVCAKLDPAFFERLLQKIDSAQTRL